MAYTDEQIQAVCEAAADVMKDFTVPQNCTFPSTAIIESMKAGLSAEEIADNAYETIRNLPLYQTGYGTVGIGTNMFNIASFMRGAVLNAINNLNS